MARHLLEVAGDAHGDGASLIWYVLSLPNMARHLLEVAGDAHCDGAVEVLRQAARAPQRVEIGVVRDVVPHAARRLPFTRAARLRARVGARPCERLDLL
eukprot:3417416-Prymnesium_polylepis.1